MRKRTAAALAALLAAAAASPRPAPAKELGAGCSAVPSLIERLRNVMILAAVYRTRGSAIGAYQVLRTNAESFVHDRGAKECGALPSVLERGLARAATSSSAADAGVELDLSYTAALSVALAGRMAPNDVGVKRLEVAESAQYGDDCPDVFSLVRRLGGAPAGLGARVADVLGDLKKRPRCPKLKDLLEASAPDALPAAVDAFLLDELQGSPSATNPIARCPELPLVLDRSAPSSTSARRCSTVVTTKGAAAFTTGRLAR